MKKITLLNSITDVPGIKVGHAHNLEGMTGCTVILCEKGAVAGVSQRGGAPGTRETDLLRPSRLVEKIHAILLAGGSAFGLDAAAGVMQFLEEKSFGFKTADAIVPIVPSAILYDLSVGKAEIRPDKQMGYDACLHAQTGVTDQGNVGAGTGASVGKLFGIKRAMKSGIGMSSIQIDNDTFVGAIVAVNAFGDIVDYSNRKIIAGARKLLKGNSSSVEPVFADTLDTMKSQIGKAILNYTSGKNTIIGVIATNASLSKEQALKLADAASNGIALCVRPAFTMFDGDTIFSLSTGSKKVDINILCGFAPYIFADAIINGVKFSKSLGGLPSFIN